MNKYEPLGAFLRRWGVRNSSADEVDLSFAQIEQLLRSMLPRAAARPDWWTNDPGADVSHPHSRAWRQAGFDATLHEDERVTFRRCRR